MAMRLSGLMSGMDTESIVQDLVAARRTKVDTMKKNQTKLEWKQDAWKELNTKIKKLYNGTLSNLRFQSSYAKKITKISNSSVADIITSDGAMESVQTLQVKKLAQSGYLTSGVVQRENGGKCTTGTKLTDMGIEAGSKIEVNTGNKTTEIEVTDTMTVGSLVSQLNNAGVKANFDTATQRFFIGASGSGEKADFSITANNADGTDALKKLGMLVYDDKTIAQYQKLADMRTDATAYQKALDDEVAARLKSYVSKAENLQKSVTKQEENLQKMKDAYAADMGDDFEDLLSNTDGKFDTLKGDIADLKEQIETMKANGEDTTEKEAELTKLNAKVDWVEKYQKAEEDLDTTRTQLSEAESFFTEDADGNKVATEALTTQVTEWLEAKIGQAKAVIDTDPSARVGSVGASKVQGQDAQIFLNGAEFTSAGNTFEINGLTITCNAETGDEKVTLTTQKDTSGIYDMLKNFIKEYSALINEMDKLYNAENPKGYEPLTDDEKDAMSEKEVEKWEQKIKDSILRRDSTLNTVSSAFKTIMSSGFSVNGKTMYLADFGIETLGYFEAEDNEKNAFHILGDEDDEAVSGKDNKLKNWISTDPDAVMDFFTQLTKSLYSKTSDLMRGVEGYSSAFTVYEDKKMKSDYDDYTKKIADMEKKLQAYEDTWYRKFSKMETAMAKMQSNSSAVMSMLGGGS